MPLGRDELVLGVHVKDNKALAVGPADGGAQALDGFGGGADRLPVEDGRVLGDPQGQAERPHFGGRLALGAGSGFRGPESLKGGLVHSKDRIGS